MQCLVGLSKIVKSVKIYNIKKRESRGKLNLSLYFLPQVTFYFFLNSCPSLHTCLNLPIHKHGLCSRFQSYQLLAIHDFPKRNIHFHNLLATHGPSAGFLTADCPPTESAVSIVLVSSMLAILAHCWPFHLYNKDFRFDYSQRTEFKIFSVCRHENRDSV